MDQRVSDTKISRNLAVREALFDHFLNRRELVISGECASLLHESSFRHVVMTYGDSLSTNLGELQAAPAQLEDIPATILGLIGVAPQASMTGRDIFGI